MTIKKYQGKTKDEAIENAKADLGNQCVIMNVKEVRPGGFFGIFKKTTYEVTAAIEDELAGNMTFSDRLGEQEKAPTQVSSLEQIASHGFDAVADEKLPVGDAVLKEPKTKPADPFSSASEQDLRSAFREVRAVIDQADHITTSQVSGYREDTPVIKQDQIHAPETSELRPRDVSKEKISVLQEKKPSPPREEPSGEKKDLPNSGFVRTVYHVLLQNEVDERYVNRILDDMQRLIASDNSLDYLISNIYQKMVLKLGQPKPIRLSAKKPTVVFFVGPTGVGKTTTIAKIASRFKVEQGKNVAFLTADTYRIAAAEQLNVYAQILQAPISVIYTPDELQEKIREMKEADLILVDTVGFSHKNEEQRQNLKDLLESMPEDIESCVYLVLSATTKYQDLREIIDSYKTFAQFRIIFTKLDETSRLGNILNARMYSGAELSYVTDGQNVPDDIEVLDAQKLVRQLLGGR